MPRSNYTGESKVPVLYLDLDGTVRWGLDQLGRFVNTADDVRVFNGVRGRLDQYKRLGWRIVGISNQGGIALGHLSMEMCARAMLETQSQCGNAFDKIMWCSHHPDAEDPEMAVCWCRKPKPGLIIESALELAEKYGEIYPPHMGLFVGDMDVDWQVANNAGLRFMYADEWREGKHLNEITR